MTEVSFSFRGSNVLLSGGNSFVRPHFEGFSDTASEEMQGILQAIRTGTSWRDEVHRRFGETNPWLHDIILSAKRIEWFNHLPSLGKRVLDIGCGWGQFALPLALKGSEVTALEPSRPRLEFVEAAARQDKVNNNIAFVGADYLECQFESRFDAILCIGVLEWIGTFNANDSPQALQQAFLSKTRSELSKDGILVIGIENRTGAKYILGCPDDHLGVPGIACLPAESASRHWMSTTGHELRSFTYTDFELRGMLESAGFTDIQLYGAFPDYKLTEWVIPLANHGSDLNKRLLEGRFPREHNGFNGVPLDDAFHEKLLAFYRDTAHQGIAQHFVPSFFLVAR